MPVPVLTRRGLLLQQVCGDIHEMHAAMAAASRLGQADGLEMDEAAALAQESMLVSSAISTLGDEAAARARLQDAASIDQMVGRFWKLLQLESQRMHDGLTKLTAGVADVAGRPAAAALQPGVVTRIAYTEFHVRVNTDRLQQRRRRRLGGGTDMSVAVLTWARLAAGTGEQDHLQQRQLDGRRRADRGPAGLAGRRQPVRGVGRRRSRGLAGRNICLSLC